MNLFIYFSKIKYIFLISIIQIFLYFQNYYSQKMGKGEGNGEGWGEGEGKGSGQGEFKGGLCSSCDFNVKCKYPFSNSML